MSSFKNIVILFLFLVFSSHIYHIQFFLSHVESKNKKLKVWTKEMSSWSYCLFCYLLHYRMPNMETSKHFQDQQHIRCKTEDSRPSGPNFLDLYFRPEKTVVVVVVSRSQHWLAAGLTFFGKTKNERYKISIAALRVYSRVLRWKKVYFG